uniref:Uncharacterized protein n=1 Tax=Opuntia streptacantha TaxID=393608 RepID=A0A7C9EBC7_OPUST
MLQLVRRIVQSQQLRLNLLPYCTQRSVIRIKPQVPSRPIYICRSMTTITLEYWLKAWLPHKVHGFSGMGMFSSHPIPFLSVSDFESSIVIEEQKRLNDIE